MSKGANVPGQPLPLVAQPSEFPQLDLAERRPTAEEKRHTLITQTPRDAKLVGVKLQEVPGKVLDHVGRKPLSGPTRRRRMAPWRASYRVVPTTSGSSRTRFA